MTGGIAIFFFIFCILCAHVNCMDPVRSGNENFPPTALTDDSTTLDAALPSFNIHYNHEPRYWNVIENIEKENSAFSTDIKEEIRLMEEDKKKIKYILGVQKQQIEQLLLLINRIMYNKKNNVKEKEEQQENESVVYNYLRVGVLKNENTNSINNNNNDNNNNKIVQLFNEINDYTFSKSRLMEQENFYQNLAEQWVN